MKISFIAPEIAIIATLLMKTSSTDELRKAVSELIANKEKLNEFADSSSVINNAFVSFKRDKESIDFATSLMTISASDHFFMDKRDIVISGENVYLTLDLIKKYDTLSNNSVDFDFSISSKIDTERLTSLIDSFSNDVSIVELVSSDDGPEVLYLNGVLNKETWEALKSIGIVYSKSPYAIKDSDSNNGKIAGVAILFNGSINALSMMFESADSLPEKIAEDIRKLPMSKKSKEE